MSQLPSILNEKIPLTIKGTEFLFHKPTLKDFAEIQNFRKQWSDAKETEESIEMKTSLLAVMLCLKHEYPEVTMEYVDSLFEMMDAEVVLDVLKKVGFIPPQANPVSQ